MSKVEVLVASMHQSDLSKFHEMNISSDVVFANQTDSYSYVEELSGKNRIRMISTNELGVGRNRNLALLLAKGEICLLSDEDVTYVDKYDKIIEDAFNKIPQADIIIFNIETIGKDVGRRINKNIKRVGIFNFLNYGAVRIAFRRDRVVNKNIWFTLKFGGGATYSAGEDSLFLREALRKKLKIYTYPVQIAHVKQEESTWFTGYNEKYFFDKGAFLEAAFPLCKYAFAIYYSIKYSHRLNSSFFITFKQITKGIRAYKKGLVYEQE